MRRKHHRPNSHNANTLRWLEENHGLFGTPCGTDWDHQKEIVYMGYRIIFDSGEDGIMYFDEDHD